VLELRAAPHLACLHTNEALLRLGSVRIGDSDPRIVLAAVGLLPRLDLIEALLDSRLGPANCLENAAIRSRVNASRLSAGILCLLLLTHHISPY